jgi:transcriptional regulator with XRE-family HTH domain
MMNDNGPDADALCFGERFRRLRKQHAGKQMTLVASGLRCTDAAISHWETGRRLPSATMLWNAARVLVRLGATEGDIQHLRSAWSQEHRRRSQFGRRPQIRHRLGQSLDRVTLGEAPRQSAENDASSRRDRATVRAPALQTFPCRERVAERKRLRSRGTPRRQGSDHYR